MKKLTNATRSFFKGKAVILLAGISAVLLIVACISTYIAISNHKMLPQALVSQFPFIDLSRHYVNQKDFIVNIQPLRENLRKIVAEEGPNSISVYFEFLNTGANVSINQDLKIWPASLVKIPIAMAAVKKVENGEWELGNELVYMPGDRDMEWGDLYKKPIGSRFTIEYLLEQSLVYSDNTATRILYRNLSIEELENVINEVGLEELFTTDGKISAKEYSRLFRALYTASYLDREHSQMLLSMLTHTGYDEYLKQGIPEEVAFAHKLGDNTYLNVILDSGIVYVENRPYLLTVAIDMKGGSMSREKGLEIMKNISASAYSYISAYER